MQRLRRLVAGLRQRRANDRDTALFLRNAFRLLHFNRIDGDYAEFGCQRFLTFQMAWRAHQAQPKQRKFWAFGSFDRIPEPQTARDLHPRFLPDTPLRSEASFLRRCRWAGITSQHRTVVRMKLQAPQASDPLPDQLAFVLISTHSFSENRAVLRWLQPRLVTGVILAFEHYHCGTRFDRSGARNALLDLQASRPDLGFEPYRQFGLAGQSFIVEDA